MPPVVASGLSRTGSVRALVFTQALCIPVGIDFLDALLLGSRQLGKVILDGLLLGLPGVDAVSCRRVVVYIMGKCCAAGDQGNQGMVRVFILYSLLSVGTAVSTAWVQYIDHLFFNKYHFI
jgi:hypothetical protein